MNTLLIIIIGLLVLYSIFVTIRKRKFRSSFYSESMRNQELQEEYLLLRKNSDKKSELIKNLIKKYGQDIHHIGVVAQHSGLDLSKQAKYLDHIGFLIKILPDYMPVDKSEFYQERLKQSCLNELDIKFNENNLLSISGDLLCNDWKERIKERFTTDSYEFYSSAFNLDIINEEERRKI